MATLIDNGRLDSQHLKSVYQKDGFFVLRDIFQQAEMLALAEEATRLLDEHRDLISPNNLRCRYMAHHQTGEQMFEVFDPVNDISAICESFCFDRRVISVIEDLYGEPACLFKDKLIFKPPGALGYQLHQDIPKAWAGFPSTFLTVMIPIDACCEENGCTEVFSGYHDGFLSKDDTSYMLPDDVVDAARRTPLILKPGDVAIFHGLTPHRSDPNRSDEMRRILYISYNALSDGGDQRDAHYSEFHERMRSYRQCQSTEPVYFK